MDFGYAVDFLEIAKKNPAAAVTAATHSMEKKKEKKNFTYYNKYNTIANRLRSTHHVRLGRLAMLISFAFFARELCETGVKYHRGDI